MIRGLLVALIHLLLVPPLASLATIVHLVRPRTVFGYRCARLWARALFRAAGARVRTEGMETLESCRPAVVVANHSSNFDVFALSRVVPAPFLFPAKSSLFRIPLFGAAMHQMGMVPLDRTGSMRDVERIDQLARGFRRRALLLFFPEGTRVRDGRLRRFKKGAFVVAMKYQVPVIPVAIVGAHRIQPAGSWRVRPGTVTIRVLEPIPTTGLGYEDRDILRERAEQAIRDALPDDQR